MLRDIEPRLVCQDHDPDIWHEDDTEARAIELCTTGNGGQPCPGLAACLDYSTDPKQELWTRSGVWGGVGANTRGKIRARRAKGESLRYPIVTFPAPNCQTPVTEFTS